MFTPPLAKPLDLAQDDTNEPLTWWQLYFGFRGRIGRQVWWRHGVAALLLAGFVLTALLRIAGASAELAEGFLQVLLLWPTLALSAKRWHDLNKSGAWTLVVLVPVLGTLWLLIANGTLRGEAGHNRFGDDWLDRLSPR